MFEVTNIALRSKMMYAATSLTDHLEYLQGLIAYERQIPILERLQYGSRELISIFREFGKSTLAEELATNELAFKKPTFVLYFSNSDEAAIDHLDAIKHNFTRDTIPSGEDNPLQQLVPAKGSGNRWKEDDFILTNGNRCAGGGAGKFVLGKKHLKIRPTLIIVDDPVPKEPGRDKTMIEWFRRTILPMGGPMTRIIIIGTPRRYQDIIMEYLNDPDGTFNIHFLPAVDTSIEPPVITAPEFWMRKGSCCNESLMFINSKFKCGRLKGMALAWMHIEQKKKDVKSLGWSTEYELKPVDDGSSLFPMEYLKRNRDKNLTFEHFKKIARNYNFTMTKGGIIESRTPCVVGIDLAISESKDADFTVMTVMGIDPPRTVMDVRAGRGWSDVHKKSHMDTLNKLYSPIVFAIESNGYQRAFPDDVIRTTNLPVMKFETGSQKNQYEVGIPTMQYEFESSNYRIPIGDEASREYTKILFRQLNGLLYENGKVVSVTKHDDHALSFWIADDTARKITYQTVTAYSGFRMSA